MKVHTHKHVSEHDRRSAASNLFEARSHHPGDLRRWIYEYISNAGSGTSSRQRRARSQLRNGTLGNHTSYSSDLNSVAKAYLPIFDDLFFFGSLKERCTVSLKSLDDHTSGYSNVRIHDNGGDTCTIYIDMKGSGDVKKLLGTLAHEMVHAFIRLFSCLADECDWERHGRTGHGRTWEVIARAIERSVNADFGLGIDLGIGYNVKCEGTSSETIGGTEGRPLTPPKSIRERLAELKRGSEYSGFSRAESYMSNTERRLQERVGHSNFGSDSLLQRVKQQLPPISTSHLPANYRLERIMGSSSTSLEQRIAQLKAGKNSSFSSAGQSLEERIMNRAWR